MQTTPSGDQAIAQLRALLDASTEIGIVGTDPGGVVTLFNRGAEGLLGYTAQDILAKQTPMLWHDMEEVADRAQALDAEPSFDFLVDCATNDAFSYWSVIDKAGRRRSVSLRMAPVNITGQEGGVLFVMVDVTVRLETARELREKAELLEHTNKDLEEFTRAASHDLTAPLRSVRSLIRFVIEDVGDSIPDTPRRYLDLIDQRIARMDALLRGLLEYARSGLQPSTATVFVMKQLLERVISNLDVPDGMAIRQELPETPVQTYHAPLECCLRNLISNAIKHQDRDEGAIVIVAELQGDQLQVDVIDDGPGIDVEYRERVFRPFESLQSRDKVEGSGLGLSIVRRYADSVGGAIEVIDNATDETNETPQRGVTMRLTWPVLEVTETPGS
ncbi:MAG: ATP-binding protein [Planctomycetota bacterium]